jgi:acyl-CoA synthetase (AMP-forming)/AMP-acid ligase II/uncharacterized membrane protein
MRAERSVSMATRPSRVWELIRDPSRYGEWMKAITRFEPIDPQAEIGRGARYDMRMRVGSVEVGGEVELTEYDPCRDLAWHSVSGIDQRGRLRIRETSPGLTTVTFRLSYQSPGGAWGLIADQVSGTVVRRNLRDSLTALQERCAEPSSRASSATDTVDFVRGQLAAGRVLIDAGVLRPSRPDRMLATLLALRRWGLTIPGGFSASAARYPDATAVVDERGSATFAAIDLRTNAMANAFREAGLGEQSRVGILCRNHAGFVEALVALTKVGADVLLLNTGFAPPQLRDVITREGVDAIVHDSEFSAALRGVVPVRQRFLAWSGAERSAGRSLQRLAVATSSTEPVPPEQASRVTILTSGTTGTPKGAERAQPHSANPIVSMLSRIPLRSRRTTMIAVPMFHAWGLANLGLAFVLSSTIVLRREFDPEETLADIERYRVDALIAVPVMLRRIMELPAARRRRYDTSSLSLVAVSGSHLPGHLATEFMDEFGDILYNLYGSTEVSAATIATPDELRRAPGTAGKPPYGTVVRLLDSRGREVRGGQPGRIFVGNDMLFEGYTHGDGVSMVDGLMATGDIGRFDRQGLLFVEGRSDDMIVSGGENVFPTEIEKLLSTHPSIVDTVVVGVPDDEWGQRLRAYVVKRGRARLTEDAVKRHVRSHLARYKVPRDVVFVQRIPRNATGKVVKSELGVG